jgi:hypothetical protein
MLARVAEVPETGPGARTPGFLYLYTSDLEGLRARLLGAGHQADEIEDAPGPGPGRQMCVRDPDGHGHMVAELFEGSVGRDPMGRGGLAQVAPRGSPAEASHALAFAERIAQVCSHRLGQTLASLIIHGSLTLGDYRSDRSDIDLLAIVARSLNDAELESLTHAVAAEQANTRCRVDLRVVTETIAASPVEAPPLELYVRLRPSRSPEILARQPEEPDLVVELSICREHARTLRGASPRQLIGPVPHQWVVTAGDVQLARWESLTDDAPYAELMVLTACRVWRFTEEHTYCSKSEAGLWALARDPSLQAVRDALRLRAGDRMQVAPAEIGRLLKIVRARIAASENA